MKRFIPFLTLVERECYRFGRLAGQTIAPPVITTSLFILIFGYSLGAGIREISGFRYILYILPGLAGMAVITNSYSNSSTSLFMARVDRSIENIVAAPIPHHHIVAAFVLGGMIRGMTVGFVTLLVGFFLTPLSLHSLLLTFFYLLFVSGTFSSLGIISALWAEDWDHLATFSNFVITPFIYLGGVFYSAKMLPPVWQLVSYGNPMLYLIEGFRYAILGVSDISPVVAGSVTLVLAITTLAIAVHLFRIGYKLVV